MASTIVETADCVQFLRRARNAPRRACRPMRIVRNVRVWTADWTASESRRALQKRLKGGPAQVALPIMRA